MPNERLGEIAPNESERPMIRGTIERQGDDFAVTIPEDEIKRWNLQEGDTVVVHAVAQEVRTVLRPEVQQAFDESWEQNEAGYRYLADR